MVGLLSFLVCVCFAPGISGGAVTPRWALLAVLVPLLARVGQLTVGHLALYLLLAWSALSLSWGADPYGGVLQAARLALFVGVFLIGAQQRDLRQVWIGAAWGLGVSSAVAVAQLYGWKGVLQSGIPGGLFFNPNFMAEAGVLVIVGLLADRLYWYIPLVLPAALLPMSRGAMLALVVSLVVWSRSKVIMACAAVAVLGAGLYTTQTGYRVSSVDERLSIWRDSLDGMTWLGSGAGSFYLTYPEHATRTNTLASRPDHAHNDFLEAFYTLGVGGVLLVALFAIALGFGLDRAAWLVLLALGVEAAFEFPLHMPVTALLGAMAAGRLCADGPRVRVLLDGWRNPRSEGRAARTLRHVAARRGVVAP